MAGRSNSTGIAANRAGRPTLLYASTRIVAITPNGELAGEQRQKQLAHLPGEPITVLDLRIERAQEEVQREQNGHGAQHDQPEGDGLGRMLAVHTRDLASQRAHGNPPTNAATPNATRLFGHRFGERRPTAECTPIATMPQAAAGAGPSRPMASAMAPSDALNTPWLVSTVNHSPPNASTSSSTTSASGSFLWAREIGGRGDRTCQQ